MAGAPHPHTYMGWWGSLGSPKQKYITQYTISPYAAKPLKGAAYNADFQYFQKNQESISLCCHSFVVVWSIWTRARDYNEYLYTKEGREELEELMFKI